MDSLLKGKRASLDSPSFHGWRFAAIGATLNALLSGFYGRGFTVYFMALARDLKLSHASTSLVFGLSALEGGLQSPITGIFIDRWGPRIMMVIGAALAGVGFLLLPLANSYPVFLLILILAVEANALMGPGLATQKPLGTVSGTVHLGLGLTAVVFILMGVVI